MPLATKADANGSTDIVPLQCFDQDHGSDRPAAYWLSGESKSAEKVDMIPMTSTVTSTERKTGASVTSGTLTARTTPAFAIQWFAMVAEGGRFIARRLEEDLKAQQAFLRCRTPAEVMHVQADYYKTAVGQYSAEASRILGAMSSVMRAPPRATNSIFARSYDDVPL